MKFTKKRNIISYIIATLISGTITLVSILYFCGCGILEVEDDLFFQAGNKSSDAAMVQIMGTDAGLLQPGQTNGFKYTVEHYGMGLSKDYKIEINVTFRNGRTGKLSKNFKTTLNITKTPYIELRDRDYQ